MRISLVQHTQYLRTILREWMPKLSPSEFVILMFVFDRTIGWSKNAEYIPRTHFLKGVHRGAQVIHAGVKISICTLKRVLASLAKRRFIIVTPVAGRPNCYEINFERDRPGIKMNPHRRDKIVLREKAETAASPHSLNKDRNPETVRGAVNLAMIRNRAARGKKVSKASKSIASNTAGSSISKLFIVWQSFCRQNFPGITVLPWRVAEKGIMSTIRKKCIEGKMTPVQFIEFLKWSVENWNSIMASRFHWMKQPPAPAFPSIKFLVRWLADFVELKERGVSKNEVERMPKQSERTLGKKRVELAKLEKQIARMKAEKEELKKAAEDGYRGAQERAKVQRLARFSAEAIWRDKPIVRNRIRLTTHEWKD